MSDELIAVLESQAAMRAALALIAAGGCEHFSAISTMTCRSEGSGKIKGSPYGAYEWCPACVAADALNRPVPKQAGRVLKVTWAQEAVAMALARFLTIRDGDGVVMPLHHDEQALAVAIDALRATRGDDDPV